MCNIDNQPLGGLSSFRPTDRGPAAPTRLAELFRPSVRGPAAPPAAPAGFASLFRPLSNRGSAAPAAPAAPAEPTGLAGVIPAVRRGPRNRRGAEF